MFDKLDDLLIRLEEILRDLSEPGVANDTKRFQQLMKEQAELTPIADTYKEYKQAKQDEVDALAMLDEESDDELREKIADASLALAHTTFNIECINKKMEKIYDRFK